jgi:pimeloyl-ACP methyl ester carboxylesterase
VAWHSALWRPDRITSVVGLSTAYTPRGSRLPTEGMRALRGDGFYMLYFQEPGVADEELGADPRRTLRMLLYSASGDAPLVDPVTPAGGGFLDFCSEPDELPAWLTEADLDAFTEDYAKTGFTGGLNWYRNLDRTWELTAAWSRAKITQPALYIAGEQDLVVNAPGFRQYLARMSDYVPNLRRTVLLPGCGHWTQQERPAEVNSQLIEFLQT